MKRLTYNCLLTVTAVLASCTFKFDVNLEKDAAVAVGDAGFVGEGDADSGFSPDPDAESQDDVPVTRDAGRLPPHIEPTQHQACAQALPRELPALPAMRSDVTGRPGFDLWRDLSCHSVGVAEYPLCSPTELVSTEHWPCDECVLGAEDAGVCASEPFGSDRLDCEYLTHRGSGCRACVPHAAKARACCAGMFGADCRAWPFPENSRRGESCARHADCEPGLVCTGIYGGYGVCLCPGETTRDVIGLDGCERASDAGAP